MCIDVSFPAGLTGGPAIQFGGFQGHFSGPHRIGLERLQRTLFLNLDFNRWDLYYRAYKKIKIKKNNNTTICKVPSHVGGHYKGALMDKNRNVVHNSSTDNKGRYMIV